MLMDTTPASLLKHLRQPAREPAAALAWARFVKLYTPLIYYWVRRFGVSEQDAADLVQDVFTVLIKKLPGFNYDRHKSFRGWLWTITLNKWRDYRRRRTVSPVKELDTGLLEPAITGDTEAVEEREYQQYVVGRALELLRADFQPATWKAFWEYVVVDRPVAEVAAELGVSFDVVYAAKSRVLRRLRRDLEGLLE
jgi:RNA polymerase sigma-70 factor (ECF subfamily)